ncbi:hypothetical protein [Gymnodinialimonas ulvae]|uniref:hypothetical protein n=1 Tax=Gymnodinialimonas ulvae TaxID=3126504 RepID=UPI003094A9D3
MKNRIVPIGFATMALLLAGSVAAQTMLCGQREMVVDELTGRYGEEVRGMGLAHQNRIVEVFVSEETGTWTITVTSPNGTTCLMAAGQHFATMAPEAAGEDL